MRWSPPARAIGKPAGFLAGSVEMAEAWREEGFRAIAYNTDIGLLQDSLRGALAAVASRGPRACIAPQSGHASL